jgi:hypothetical protein
MSFRCLLFIQKVVDLSQAHTFRATFGQDSISAIAQRRPQRPFVSDHRLKRNQHEGRHQRSSVQGGWDFINGPLLEGHFAKCYTEVA